MLYVMFGISCSTLNVLCFKELPFGLCGVSLKAMLFSFVINHAFLHVYIMCFVGIQILCQHAFKLTNVNFSWHYSKFIAMY